MKLLILGLITITLVLWPAPSYAETTQCRIMLDTLYCDTYPSPGDSLQKEAELYQGTDWYSQINKPNTPSASTPPTFNYPASGGGMSSELVEPFQKGVGDVYQRINEYFSSNPQSQPPAKEATLDEQLEQLKSFREPEKDNGIILDSNIAALEPSVNESVPVTPVSNSAQVIGLGFVLVLLGSGIWFAVKHLKLIK